MADTAWTDLIRSRAARDPVEAPDGATPRLHGLAGVRAVVFDVYGTLFSSGAGDISLVAGDDRSTVIGAALERAGCRLNGPAAGLDRAFRRVIDAHRGERAEAGVEWPEVNIHLVWRDLVEALAAEKRLTFDRPVDTATLAVDYESAVNPVRLMPGCADVLAALRQSGRALGIVSNAQFFTPLLFEAFLDGPPESLGFTDACCVWSYELLEAKPSTRLYELCAGALEEAFGITAGEALYVGNDLRNDIRPARACGFRTALFAGDRLSLRRRQDDPSCAGVEPDIEITHLSQIIDCLD